jgi:hypothetical protein
VVLDLCINELLNGLPDFEVNRTWGLFYPRVVMLNRVTFVSESNHGIIENAFEECICRGSSLANA